MGFLWVIGALGAALLFGYNMQQKNFVGTPAPTVTRRGSVTYQGKSVTFTVFSNNTAEFSGSGIHFFVDTTNAAKNMPVLTQVIQGSAADAQAIINSLG